VHSHIRILCYFSIRN